MMVFIRPATINDAKSVFDIRNHKVVRCNSWNTEELDYKQHVSWFKDNFQYYWMIYEDKGFIRIKDGEVSIAINPLYHNCGIGSEALRMLCVNKDLMASIRFDNASSIRCFCKAGFVPVGLIMKNNSYGVNERI